MELEPGVITFDPDGSSKYPYTTMDIIDLLFISKRAKDLFRTLVLRAEGNKVVFQVSELNERLDFGEEAQVIKLLQELLKKHELRDQDGNYITFSGLNALSIKTSNEEFSSAVISDLFVLASQRDEF